MTNLGYAYVLQRNGRDIHAEIDNYGCFRRGAVDEAYDKGANKFANKVDTSHL
jgi:hypothetical protein